MSQIANDRAVLLCLNWANTQTSTFNKRLKLAVLKAAKLLCLQQEGYDVYYALSISERARVVEPHNLHMLMAMVCVPCMVKQ